MMHIGFFKSEGQGFEFHRAHKKDDKSLKETVCRLGLVPMIFSKILEVRGTEKMKKIQKSAARFDNLKQDFLDDKKYSGTAEATLNG